MKKVTIELPDEDYEYLESMAKPLNKTVDEWITFFITQTTSSVRLMNLARNAKKELG